MGLPRTSLYIPPYNSELASISATPISMKVFAIENNHISAYIIFQLLEYIAI